MERANLRFSKKMAKEEDGKALALFVDGVTCVIVFLAIVIVPAVVILWIDE
jgi:hypothetical protein